MLFIGHSHMVCVLTAAQEAGVPLQAVGLKLVENEEHLFGVSRGAIIEDTGKPDFRDGTKALIAATSEPVYSFISGIMHVQLGMRRVDDPSEAPFDFVLPEAPAAPLDAGADLVPADAVREVLRYQFKMRLKILKRLAAVAPGRIVQFAPPPPVSDTWLEARLAQSSPAPAELPNRWLRWKLWRLTTDLFRQQAVSLGERFVDSPPESMDRDGFMRDEYVRNATHGNTAFGALVLAQIRSLS